MSVSHLYSFFFFFFLPAVFLFNRHLTLIENVIRAAADDIFILLVLLFQGK